MAVPNILDLQHGVEPNAPGVLLEVKPNGTAFDITFEDYGNTDPDARLKWTLLDLAAATKFRQELVSIYCHGVRNSEEGRPLYLRLPAPPAEG